MRGIRKRIEYSHDIHFVILVSLDRLVARQSKIRIRGSWSEFISGKDEEDVRGHFSEHFVQPLVLKRYCNL